jgi:hypothetical protein
VRGIHIPGDPIDEIEHEKLPQVMRQQLQI